MLGTSHLSTHAAINDLEPIIDREFTIIDTVAARAAYTQLETVRAERIDTYTSLIAGLKLFPMHFDRKASPLEQTALDSMIQYPAVKALPDYQAVVKAASKGKIHKSLQGVFDEYHIHLRGILNQWSDTFLNMSALPTVQVTRSVHNRYYRPANVRNSAVLDTLDYSEQLAPEWEWVDTHRSKEHQMVYPYTFSYRKYQSHPDLRVIGNYIFDDQGNLVRVKCVARTEPQIADRNSRTWDGIKRLIAARDYEADKYEIQSEGDVVNSILRARLGIDNNPELAAESNMTVDNWYNRVVNEHLDEFSIIYRIDRVDDTSFNIFFLNSKGKSTWQIQFAYTANDWDVERTVSRIRRAPDITVDLNYRRPETPAPERDFYLFAETPVQYPGGAEALALFLDRNVAIRSGSGDKRGPVVVEIAVDENGKPTAFDVVRSVGPRVDYEATRVAGLIEQLVPARVNGMPVKSKFYLPIQF